MFKEKLSSITIRILYVIFALVVSVALWMYVEITENEVQIREITNIERVLKNEDVLLSKGLLISSIETELVSITFEGSRSDISRLAAQGALTVEVDLASIASPGVARLAYEIIFPQGVNRDAVRILGQSPSRITMMVDRVLVRTIPVRVSYTGGAASDDLLADTVEFDPHTITARGPEEIVSKIHYVRVPILIENLSTTYTDDLEFIMIGEDDEELDEELRESVEFSQDTISVTVPIRAIKDVTLTVDLFHGAGTSDAITSVAIQPTVVKVMGDPEVIRDFNSITLGTIDMLSFGLSDTFAFPISIPQHITNISGETEALVHVEVLGLYIAFRSTSNLQTVNEPSGHRADILTQSLDVRLRGARDDLELVTPMNIRVVADLADMGPGPNRVRAIVYIDGIEADIDPVGDYEITVTIVAE